MMDYNVVLLGVVLMAYGMIMAGLGIIGTLMVTFILREPETFSSKDEVQ